MDSPRLVGKSAIVTGGSRGIGLATAVALRSAGADVLICGRSADALGAAADRISTATTSAPPGRVVTEIVDVGQPEQVQRLVASAVEQLGGVDILINNAGVGLFSPLTELTVENWQETIETNLSGVFYCCRAVIPAMRRRGGGWIINVSSLAGKHPFSGGTAYCASKAGLNAFTEALMQEVRRDGIRVSCVLPGSVDTEFAGNEPSANAGWKLAPSDVAQTVVDLLCHPPRSLPSRVELRPAVPGK
jgi:NAD(P)-dependent dehydrogenase (short-subunit alcohol dehydrogenase family)